MIALGLSFGFRAGIWNIGAEGQFIMGAVMGGATGLALYPLDSFIVSQGGTAANRMEVDDNPNELTEAHKEFIQAVKDISGESWKVGSIERQSFYTEAKKSYAIVTTTDARPFGCFILTKGVIKPDGSVWVLEK